MRHSLPHQASLHLSDGDPRPRSRFTPDKIPAFGFFSVNNFSLALRGTSQTGGIFLGNGISQTDDAICQRQKSHRSLAPSIYPSLRLCSPNSTQHSVPHAPLSLSSRDYSTLRLARGLSTTSASLAARVAG